MRLIDISPDPPARAPRSPRSMPSSPGRRRGSKSGTEDGETTDFKTKTWGKEGIETRPRRPEEIRDFVRWTMVSCASTSERRTWWNVETRKREATQRVGKGRLVRRRTCETRGSTRTRRGREGESGRRCGWVLGADGWNGSVQEGSEGRGLFSHPNKAGSEARVRNAFRFVGRVLARNGTQEREHRGMEALRYTSFNRSLPSEWNA